MKSLPVVSDRARIQPAADEVFRVRSESRQKLNATSRQYRMRSRNQSNMLSFCQSRGGRNAAMAASRAGWVLECLPRGNGSPEAGTKATTRCRRAYGPQSASDDRQPAQEHPEADPAGDTKKAQYDGRPVRPDAHGEHCRQENRAGDCPDPLVVLAPYLKQPKRPWQRVPLRSEPVPRHRPEDEDPKGGSDEGEREAEPELSRSRAGHSKPLWGRGRLCQLGQLPERRRFTDDDPESFLHILAKSGAGGAGGYA